MNQKVWYITGASKGLGLALVCQLLAAGHRVAATSRSAAALTAAVGTQYNSHFLALETNLSDNESILRSVQQTLSTFGAIDVVVNNAGFGIGGSIEELSDEAVYESFAVNVFATIAVIKHVLPVMRQQRSGHIINIASIAGFAAAAGWSVYAATKFAVMGLSEVLADEVKELGIKVTVVAPGAFRTSFLTKDSLLLAQSNIKDYQAIRDSHARYLAMDGKQVGDPEKAAAVFIRLSEMKEPPVRFFMGSDAYQRAAQKTTQLADNLEKWKALSAATDFDQQ